MTIDYGSDYGSVWNRFHGNKKEVQIVQILWRVLKKLEAKHYY